MELVPPYFTIGKRYISVLHERLRNRCSGLNSDLFRNHIRNNPLCDLFEMVEDAYHYFFNAEKILLKGRFSMIQLEDFSL